MAPISTKTMMAGRRPLFGVPKNAHAVTMCAVTFLQDHINMRAGDKSACSEDMAQVLHRKGVLEITSKKASAEVVELAISGQPAHRMVESPRTSRADPPAPEPAVAGTDLEGMTKAQLQEKAAALGLTVSARMSHAALVEAVTEGKIAADS